MSFQFQEWWKKILREWMFADELDSIQFKESARAYLESCSKDQKDLMLDKLMDILRNEEEGDNLALNLLEGNARHSDMMELEEIARRRMAFTNPNQESFLLSFLWVLARGSKQYHTLVNEYLYNTPASRISTNIHWAFWPDHPLEFAKAYAHYLSQKGSQWKGSQYILSFFNNPEAIRYLKEYAQDREWWPEFRDELLEQCKNEFWHPDTRELIIQILKK